MAYFFLKILVSVLVIVVASELAKRSTMAAAVIVSLPLVSIMAMTWLYLESGSSDQVAAMASDIAWLVLPSMALFIALPVFLRAGVGYWLALLGAAACTVFFYGASFWLRRLLS